jgi:hypothetical protein
MRRRWENEYTASIGLHVTPKRDEKLFRHI